MSNVKRDAGGPAGGDSSSTPKQVTNPTNAADSFDPFESFDEHDRAAGITSSRDRFSRSESSFRSSGDSTFANKPDGASSEASTEAVYSRSRRTRDESASAEKSDSSTEDTSRSRRPGRSLKGRALGYLSRREYSRAELSRKLMPFADEANPLEALLDTLEREGWLSDSRFAESLIHRRASRLGTSRIVGELKRHAVSRTLIEETGAQLRETELARAQAVWRKKYGELPQTQAERARQARFLMARGFSQGVIGKILKGIEDE